MKSMTAFIVSIAVASAMVAMLASTGAAATPKKTVAFTACYSGTAAVNVTDNLANIQANGTGTGTLLGAGKVSGAGTGDSSVQPCVPFTGPGTLTGTAARSASPFSPARPAAVTRAARSSASPARRRSRARPGSSRRRPGRSSSPGLRPRRRNVHGQVQGHADPIAACPTEEEP